MRYLCKLLICVCLFGYGTFIIAQTTIPTSGGNATGSGGTSSYSVGQIVYTTYTGTNGSVSQGVQQPFEISVLTGIEEAKDISLEIAAYPNPARDFVKLIIKNFEVLNLKYRLYDFNGRLIKENVVEGNETNISMQDCLPATYILKVLQGNKEIKSFKVIKY
jgi:hypothetical protein